MPTSDLKVTTDPEKSRAKSAPQSNLDFKPTFVESPGLLSSIIAQIKDWRRQPKNTIPAEYFGGETRLPVTEMSAWYADLPHEIKSLFEPPHDPISLFNWQQDKKRALLGLALACVGAVAGWFGIGGVGIFLGIIGGYALGQGIGVLLYKKRPYPPDIWQDYAPQKASWGNSLLIHVLGLAALLLPFIISGMLNPPKATPVYDITQVPLIAPELRGPRMGGGGGGGDTTPKPPSKGAVPKFSKTQLAPPMAKMPVEIPKLPVQPTVLGPPQLKLPAMKENQPWGNPQAVLAQASNGPGSGGGIGTGEGTGVGEGKGAGVGPGEGAGYGGGVYSVGGNVTAPIPIYKPEPPYSEEARKAKYQGTCVLMIVVGVHGGVSDIHVVKPLGLGLDEKAIQTVHTWKFKPATRNGVPVPVRVMVEVSFRLF